MSNNESPRLTCGYYRHYKGGLYYVESVVQHSETMEWMVLYHAEDNYHRWVRPLMQFLESVETTEGIVPRFVPHDYKAATTAAKE